MDDRWWDVSLKHLVISDSVIRTGPLLLIDELIQGYTFTWQWLVLRVKGTLTNRWVHTLWQNDSVMCAIYSRKEVFHESSSNAYPAFCGFVALKFLYTYILWFDLTTLLLIFFVLATFLCRHPCQNMKVEIPHCFNKCSCKTF